MSEEERRAIEQDCARLIAQYANYNDAARWEELSQLYAPDGRMSRPSAPDDWIEGREAILHAFQERAPRKTRHVCSNIVIDASNATGESTMILFDDPVAPPKIGYFLDRFVRTENGWRFAERRGGLTF
jgi:SnoaL-like domain